MMDIGLLVSVIVTVAVPALFVAPRPLTAAPRGLIDTTLGAVLVGLIVARLSAVALDDPGSLTKLSNLLVIRSGVEFWPGLVAAMVWLGLGARREDTPPWLRLAAVAPAAMIGWAGYEATCLVRGGCPGPRSTIGLRPEGLTSPVFPVGLVVAAAGVAAAMLLQRKSSSAGPSPASAPTIVLTAVAFVGTIRSVASIWLPHVGYGLTRQHRTSIAMTAVALVGLGIVHLRTSRRIVASSRRSTA